jgi:hypothetical protein
VGASQVAKGAPPSSLLGGAFVTSVVELLKGGSRQISRSGLIGGLETGAAYRRKDRFVRFEKRADTWCQFDLDAIRPARPDSAGDQILEAVVGILPASGQVM